MTIVCPRPRKAAIPDDGKYQANSLAVGKYKVTIAGDGIPEKYTSKAATPLAVEVESGNNTFNFDLN